MSRTKIGLAIFSAVAITVLVVVARNVAPTSIGPTSTSSADEPSVPTVPPEVAGCVGQWNEDMGATPNQGSAIFGSMETSGLDINVAVTHQRGSCVIAMTFGGDHGSGIYLPTEANGFSDWSQGLPAEDVLRERRRANESPNATLNADGMLVPRVGTPR